MIIIKFDPQFCFNPTVLCIVFCAPSIIAREAS